jgi:hypothetical protein
VNKLKVEETKSHYAYSHKPSQQIQEYSMDLFSKKYSQKEYPWDKRQKDITQQCFSKEQKGCFKHADYLFCKR